MHDIISDMLLHASKHTLQQKKHLMAQWDAMMVMLL